MANDNCNTLELEKCMMPLFVAATDPMVFCDNSGSDVLE